MPTDNEIRRSMAVDLSQKCSDLGDEREVIRCLQRIGHPMADIVTHSDAATEEARRMVAAKAAPQ